MAPPQMMMLGPQRYQPLTKPIDWPQSSQRSESSPRLDPGFAPSAWKYWGQDIYEGTHGRNTTAWCRPRCPSTPMRTNCGWTSWWFGATGLRSLRPSATAPAEGLSRFADARAPRVCSPYGWRAGRSLDRVV